MIITWLFAFGLAPSPASAATPVLKPTRLEWCAALLSVRDRRPADLDQAGAAVAVARRQLDEILRRRDPGPKVTLRDKTTAGAEVITPHHARVEANLSRPGPFDVDPTRALRRSRGRLAGLARDLARPDPEYPPRVRIDVGRAAVTAALAEIADEAARRTDRDQPKPGPEYYVRSLGNGAALTSLIGAFGFATEQVVGNPNQNLFGLFLGATVMSAWGLWDFVSYHRRHLATEAGRVALENRHNPERRGDEPDALERLRRLTVTPTGRADLYAHHGYAVRAPKSETSPPSSWIGGRRASVMLVDMVLYEDAAGEPTLMTALRRGHHPSE